YPEYVPILHAAKELGRPVKWTADRFESFLSDHHGRDHEFVGELALDAKGKFLAVRFTGYGNTGAYLGPVSPLMSTLNIVKNAVSVYKLPLIEVSTKVVFTNTVLVSAYRGAGRPEGNYYMERLIDRAAHEMGIERFSLRKRNQMRASEIPYKAASGMQYDSGDFPAVFERAVEIADVKGFKQRRREAKRRGKLRGLGIGSYLEVTAPPNKEMGGIRFETNGDVTIITGTLDYGQGHAAPFAQVLSEKLGIPLAHQAAAGRQRRAARRRRHRRLALDVCERHRDRRRRRPGDRERQADRWLRARSGGERHRVQGGPLHHRGHRPLGRHHGACREAALRPESPRGR